MKKHLLHALLFTVSMAVCVPAASAEGYPLPPYPSMEWRLFEEYNGWREPCQQYQPPPAGYEVKSCRLVAIEQSVPAPAMTPAPEPAPAPAPVSENKSYTIYFSPEDNAALSDGAAGLVKYAAAEMKTCKDVQATVSGHTSTTDTHEYNQDLSRRRANAVAKALVTEGISPQQIREEAYGETRLAVPTPDNTPMPANRRVVIEFPCLKTNP